MGGPGRGADCDERLRGGMSVLLHSRFPMRTALLTLAAAAALAAQTADIPAFSNGARILLQGDSITDMNRGRTAVKEGPVRPPVA